MVIAVQSDVIDAPALRRKLLGWYDRHRRVMPWRALSGRTADPYHVWLSEIMLQQTTVVTVGPYFQRFLERWPDIHGLAAADLDEILHGWQGLGYYARARNLHRCAQVVSRDHGGVFPGTEAALLTLPGIGPYTAAAIAAIAFNRPASVVDGNVERVMARLFAIQTRMPDAKTEMRGHAADLAPTTSRGRPGDYAQALMDLGAVICTPRNPKCGQCPIADYCAAHAAGIEADLPRRAAKKAKPTRKGVAFWAVTKDGEVLIRRRIESGLLGGMMEIPSTEWREEGWTDSAALKSAPASAAWRPLTGIVRHTFTHFHLELSFQAAIVKKRAVKGGVWCPPERLGEHALPTVMKKVVAHALKGTAL
jgi:A/G-specific adenine glycosylase